MAGFFRHIEACNNHDPTGYLPFRIRGQLVGRLRPSFARQLAVVSELFQCSDSGVDLDYSPQAQDEVTAKVHNVLEQLVDQGVMSHLHGEKYAVSASWGTPVLLTLDRAAAPYFGIRAYGQHLNGFVRTQSGMQMWLGRRSADRKVFPGCLDHLVAGGLPHGMSLEQNLVKESWEEAAIPAPLVHQAKSVGAISYNADSDKGFKPDTLFCYDLQLSEDFTPRCTDGEVACFYLMPVEEVMERVRIGDEFKLNCNLVIIDFLIRHGYLGPSDSEYLSLVSGLHNPVTSL